MQVSTGEFRGNKSGRKHERLLEVTADFLSSEERKKMFLPVKDWPEEVLKVDAIPDV